jgi:hypothetical protein
MLKRQERRPCPGTAHPTGGTGTPVSETGENRVNYAGDKREDPVLRQLIQQAGQAHQCLKQEKIGLIMQVTREKILSWTVHPTGGTGTPVSETGENRVKHAGDKREGPLLG